MSDLVYMETGSFSPSYNLAFEEYVLCNKTEGNHVILWQNRNAVIIGRNQNTAEEINRAFVDKHGISVVRRITGGGAVYHDLGNLNYSFICDAGNVETMTLERFTAPVVEALQSLGLQTEVSGRNDILVNGLKVSGTAQRIYKNRVLHHGTLLFDSNVDMISGALNADPDKFKSKSAKSVRSRVGNIRNMLPEDMHIDEFWKYLKNHICAGNDEIAIMSNEEILGVRELEKTKYATWEWNYGYSPVFDMHNRKHWPGGSLEVCLTVRKGILEDIAFYGDFLAMRDMNTLCDALRGVKNTREDVRRVLSGFDMREYFGSITLDEIIDTMFE